MIEHDRAGVRASAQYLRYSRDSLPFTVSQNSQNFGQDFILRFSSLIHLVACSYLFSLQGKPSALKLSLRSILKSLILEIIAVILLESLVSSKRDGRHNLRQDD